MQRGAQRQDSHPSTALLQLFPQQRRVLSRSKRIRQPTAAPEFFLSRCFWSRTELAKARRGPKGDSIEMDPPSSPMSEVGTRLRAQRADRGGMRDSCDGAIAAWGCPSAVSWWAREGWDFRSPMRRRDFARIFFFCLCSVPLAPPSRSHTAREETFGHGGDEWSGLEEAAVAAANGGSSQRGVGDGAPVRREGAMTDNRRQHAVAW